MIVHGISRTSKEIECLKRLHQLTSQLSDIVTFLKQEGLVDDNQMRSLQQSSDFPKDVQFMLRNLQVTQRLQLLSYNWSVLPAENIDIHIITNRDSRNFVFNG